MLPVNTSQITSSGLNSSFYSNTVNITPSELLIGIIIDIGIIDFCKYKQAS